MISDREQLRDLIDGMNFAGFVALYGGALLLAGSLCALAFPEILATFGDPS
jgi:hypothetical protein